MKHPQFLISLTAFLFLGCPSQSKDFGVCGTTFEIAENNLLQVIESRLLAFDKSGKLEEHQKEISKRVEQSIQRPFVVSGVSRTQEPRSYTYDPTLTVEEDIRDHQGNMIAQRGLRINPLNYVSWGIPLLLIDGDDQDQIQMALSSEAKLILVKGAPIQLENQLNRPVFFDQGGRIVKKFGIKQVPCRISQAGDVLFVEELEPSTLNLRKKQ
jgi:conjugal transfer pilus assembly protein TraW